MFTLRGRQDKFRFILPDEFIPKEINEKYAKILQAKHSFFTKPIDFLNESIQKIQVLGINGGTVMQEQTGRGIPPIRNMARREENMFLHTATDYNYRSAANPIALVDKTFNVTFKHTLGYMNYFLLFESFMYQYARDTTYKELNYNFTIEMLSNKGSVYSKVVLMDPLIDGIDMLDLDYTQPIASSQSFNVIFKYSNIDYQFINYDALTIGNGDTIYDEDIQYIEPIQPMYEHNRTYTKYDERTGEVLATVTPTIEDINLRNSGIDLTPAEYYGGECSTIDIYANLNE